MRSSLTLRVSIGKSSSVGRFTDTPLTYRREGDGFILYSVGVNDQDDNGQSYDDEPRGDDLVVRLPLPEMKKDE